jgi:3-oxoacyl-[acyl-carrier protein] reductase
MDLELRGRTALVTGASTGIGTGIARALGNEGVRLAITARRRELLEELAASIEMDGGVRPIVVVGDLTVAADLERIVAEATAGLGQIDILVNNAGASRPAPLDVGEAFWDEAFALNFTAARRITHSVLPAMRARKWGRVINISGSMEPRGLNPSGPAKAALHLWAKSLSREIAADGVTINTIPPGRINSEQIEKRLHPTEESKEAFIARNVPIGYFGDPLDIGYLAAFLASPRARYITGDVIPVDGGMHFYAH